MKIADGAMRKMLKRWCFTSAWFLKSSWRTLLCCCFFLFVCLVGWLVGWLVVVVVVVVVVFWKDHSII